MPHRLRVDQPFSRQSAYLFVGESPIKKVYHPNAYLQRIRNVKNGLMARTKILAVLDQRVSDARAIAKETSQSYNVVIHHLRLLEADGTVNRKGRKPYSWALTGIGQKRLVS